MSPDEETLPEQTGNAGNDPLRVLVTALTDSTRGRIFVLLEFKGEMTASQLAAALGLHVNTIAHHLRILRQAGIVEEPRAVVQRNYVEKYYRVAQEIEQSLYESPQDFDERLRELPLEEKQRVFVTLMLAAASVFDQGARHLSSLAPEEFQQAFGVGEFLTSLSAVSTSEAKEIRSELRSLIKAKLNPPGKQEAESGHVVIIASFPFLRRE